MASPAPTAYLYVPGDRPERFAKALASGAGAVILDLEDAVALDAKPLARQAVVDHLAKPAPGVEQWVRIGAGSRGVDDLAAVAPAPGLTGVVVPKATPAALDAIGQVGEGVGVPRIVLLETAEAILELRALATMPGVVALALGEVDLAADLGLEPSPDGRELGPLRLQVTVASAAAGLAPPIGPVWTDLADADGLARSTDDLRRLGFGARQAVHPAQVGPIAASFTPSAEEVAAAEELLRLAADASTGAFVDAAGRMVDEAVVRRARRVLARAGQTPK